MADNSATFNLNVTSNGTTDKETKLAKNLNNELEKASKNAARVPKAVAAARQGVDNSRDSGTARGVSGLTGAEGRDFAKQASGLGGLVHVYATFAANLFAISAGFQALSKAANVTNMVKGLDQLGAASGRNLGSIAKQLSMVTDGAVSLQEAMSATAQASSAGMSSTNILRMGEVAKKASQALGRDMTDALSRLSRGITKIEPELLDELGIMVKVDQATQNYARTLGKSASSLTDFEKRQAFANEVLSQAEQKFGNIKLDANPYQKILASIQNLTQSGLELVNKVLGPIMSALSQSPTALAGVLAGLGTILLKQAIPAISSFRDNLSKAADQADAVKISIAKRRSTAYDEKDIDKVAALAAKEKAIMADLTKAKTEYLNVGKGKNLKATLSGLDATNSNLSEAVSKQAHSRELGINNTLRKKGIDLTGEALKQANLEKQAILNVTKASKDLLEVRKNLDAELAKADAPDSLTRKANQAVIDKANARATKSRIVSNTAENFVSVGPVTALKELYKEVRNATKGLDAAGKPFIDGTKNMSGFAAATTFAKASISGFAASTMLMASALSNVFMVVGLVVTAFSLLSSWASSSSKEMETFNSSTDNVNSSVEGLKNTLANINSKSLDNAIKTESLQARATAIQELSDALGKQAKDYDALVQAMNTFDKSWDSTKGFFFNMGSVGKIATSTKLSVTQMLASFSNVQQVENFKSILEEIYGIGSTSGIKIEKVIEGLTREEAVSRANKLADAFAKTSREINNAIAPATAFELALTETSKVASDLTTSLKLTDPFSKLGISLLGIGQQLDKAMEQPLESISSVVKLLDNQQLAGLLPTDKLETVVKAKKDLVNLSKEQKQYDDAALAADKLKADLTEKLNSAKLVSNTNIQAIDGKVIKNTNSVPDITKEYTTQIAAVTKEIDRLKNSSNEIGNKAKEALKKINEELLKPTLFNKAIENLNVGLKNAFAQAGLAGAKALNSAVSSLGVDTSVADAELAKREIGLKVAEIEARGSFLKAQIENTLAMKELTLAEERNSLEVAFNSKMGKLSIEEIAKYSQDKKDNDKAKDALKAGRSLLSSNGLPKQTDNKVAIGAIGIDNYAAILGLNAQKAQAAAEGPAASLKKIIASAKESYVLEGKKLDIQIQENKQQLDSLSTAGSIASVNSADYAIKVASLEKDKLRLSYEKDTLAERGTLAAIEKSLASGLLDAKNKEATKAQELLVVASLSAKQKQYSTNLTQLEYETYIKLYDIAALLKQNEIDSNRRIYDTRVQLVQEFLSLEEKRISIIEGYGLYSESEIAAKKAVVSETKQQLDNETALLTVTRAQDDARTSMLDKITKLRAAAFNEDGSTKNTEALSNLNSQLAEYGKLKIEQAQILDLTISSNAARLAGTKLLSDQAKEQARINDLTKDLVSFGDSLTAIFGKAGTAIGELAKNTILFTDQTAKYNEERKKLESVTNDNTTSIDSKQEAFKQLAKLDKKNAKDQLTNLADVAGATKKMFAEKTFAYKAAAAIEKTIHVAKIAMMIQEMIVAGTTTPPVVAANTAKAGSNALTAITAAFSAPFPVGFVAGAAMIAIMASLLGGSGPKAPPAGFTAEEQQKVQGTGQRYENGKVVNTGLGVLGDETARNESVVKGIDLIEKHSFAGLEFSNKMLEALKAIKDNTESFGKTLLNVGGIRIKADAIKGGNWLTGNTSSKIEDAGIKLSGTIEDITKGLGQLSTYTNTTESSSGFLGLFKSSDSIYNAKPLEDAKLQGEVGAIFLSVRDALVSAGDKLGVDTVAAVVNGMDVTKAFDRVSTLGLTGQEMVDAILAQVGLVMDQASLAAFPQLAKFQQIGESFTDTVIRVADDTRIVSLGMASIGKTIKPLTETVADIPKSLMDAYTAAQANLATAKLATEQTHTVTNTREVGVDANYIETYTSVVKGSAEATQGLIEAETALNNAREAITKVTGQQTTKNIEVTERLIKLAGGTDAFLSKVDFFKSNFLSEAERLAPIQKAVSAEMERLGFASITTRDQFKRLVLGIDTTTSTGQDLYTSLMNIQEGFSMVYKDIAESTKLEQELLSALGFTYDALLLQRKEELSTLSDSDRIMKERIYAVQDANKTEALQQELLDATGRSTDSLLAKRKQELRGLSSTDAALKTRIWLLQDEKKLLDAKTAQEVKIYGLLGKSEEALRLTRAQELAAIDPQLAASQLYIYALEDEASLKAKLKTAYDKEASSLKDTTSRIKDFIKTLKDYRDSLVLGDNSILTPAQKYAEAKRQFLQVSAIATNIAITDAQKQAQSEAISKLPGISDAFLTASKNIYASSDAYTSDFNSVLDILDKTSTALDAQQTDAQKTLDMLDKQSTIQQLIADNTETSATILQKLLDAMIATEAARAGASAAGSAAAGGGFTAPIGVPVNSSAFIDPTGTGWIHGANGYTGTFVEGKQLISDSLAAIDAGTLKASDLVDAIVKQGITSTMLDTILGKKEGTSSAWAIAHGITGFASGGTPRGLSLVGEEGPEFVDFRTPARVYSNGQTNSMFGTNQELLQEFKLLREEVAQLRAEQHEQTGNLIKFNYDANTMAADRIAGAQANAANSAEWSRRNQPKIV